MTAKPRPSQGQLSEEHDPFAGPVIVGTVPTTEPQREIWTATQISEEASLAYNESVTLWMTGRLDLAALRDSFGDLVARHEALRATFSADGLTMVIAAPGETEVQLVDVATLPESERESAWEALLVREVTEAFDLLRGPLARVKVWSAGPEEHRVVFTAHHIVCDGWSTAVIVHDWAELYTARVCSRPPKLEPAASFAAYAREEGAEERRRAGVADEEFWLSRFADGVPTLEIPIDRARPPAKTYGSRRQDLVIDEALVRDLRRVSSAERATLFAALFTAFQGLVARLSAQADFVVGVPTAGQAARGQEGLVGHCVNLLPLRARIDPERSFREVLGEVRTAWLEAHDHQQYTFGSLLKRLPLARDPSRLPLVSVVFNLDRGLKDDALQFEGLRTRLTTNARRFENFELFLNAVELDGRVTLECQYNEDLFDRDTVTRWLKAYVRLIRSICENPGERMGRLDILTDEDKAQLRQWNDASARAVPGSSRVHDLVQRQVERSPERVAVEFEGQRLTYRELGARSDALAEELRRIGVGAGSLVGLCAERSPDLVVAVVGILKAGAAYVPLDPGYPQDRLAFMIADSGMGVLVTQNTVRQDLSLDVRRVVLLDALPPVAGGTTQDEATGDDPAYVIYTSGSTGRPKGVLVPHRAVVNLLASVSEVPGLTARDTVLAVTTLSFDISVSEIILPLTVGAKIVLASREVASDGQRLLELLRTSGATFLDATPSTWRLLIAAGWDGGEGLKAICTGEALPRDLAKELLRRCATVWNGYGPTETTVWSTFWQVVDPIERVLIGKPVANTHLYVLDSRMQPVPIGAIGELFIGGSGVTLGYHQRPELTQERFLPDPSAVGHARMYKTGDLVRYRADGNLECLGRNDTQVKLRGFRIELGEIESVIARHDGVSQVSVIVREDRPADFRLVAYVASKPGAAPSEGDLRAHVKKALPEYMVPAHFVTLAVLPQLPNGKIDRKSLPAPVPTSIVAGFVEPRTPTERMVATLWQEVLGVGRVAVHDDFFALGGHSLLASQVIARLRRDRGIAVTFRKMFEASTVEKLAAAIDAGVPALSPDTGRIPARHGQNLAPLSVAQRRIWLLEEMDPAQRLVHNLCASWRLEGPVDLAALERAIGQVVRKHETLRMNVRLEGGEPVQFVHAERKIPVGYVDLSTVAEREAALSAERDAQAAVPFDLFEDPLLRVTLFKMESARFVLSTLQHNIIWDGWSFDVFLRELSELYEGFARGDAPTAEPPPITYSDFSAWQRDWLGTSEFEEQASFWRAQLGGAMLPLELPTDRPRKGTRSRAGGSRGIHLSLERTNALLALAREHGATLFMLLFAAYGVMLFRYTGQRQILIGVPTRARTRPEVENLIGLFVNAVALRLTVNPSMTFLELLAGVREVTLDAFGRQDVPLDALGVPAPMLRALFSLQDARERPDRLGSLGLAQEHVLAPVAASEMMLWAMETGADLLLMINFASDLFDGETIERFLGELDTLLGQVQADPDQRVASIPILPASERVRIARAGGQASIRHEQDVFSVVARVAAERPEAVAVQCDERQLSYAQLVERAGAVAALLVARGAGPGSSVSIRVAEQDGQVVAVLAVLMLGATLALGDEAAAIALDSLSEAAVDSAPPAKPSPIGSIAYRGAGGGVSVTQSTLTRALSSAAQAVGLLRADVVAVDARLRDATGLFALLLPLVVGARMSLRAQALDALSSASSAANVALLAPGARRGGHDDTVRKIVVFGASSAAQRSTLRTQGEELFELHLSEAHALPVGVDRVREGEEGQLLGRPLPNMAWHVADAEGATVPIGVGGALFVDVGEGPVATGDRARLLGDGSFESLGRTDGRVSLDDGLVDTREIAGVLEGVPAVAEAWVAVREDSGGDRRLVAYYAMKAGMACTETELRASVRATLGERVVPRMLVELDTLPRDASGAVNDERLASPYVVSTVHEYVAPRSDAESYVASIWKDALGVARIGAYDNFFDLGGHSLLCFRVIGRIEREIGKRISPRIVLLGTLEQVAMEIGTVPPREGHVVEGAPAVRQLEAQQPTKAGRVASWIKGFVKG